MRLTFFSAHSRPCGDLGGAQFLTTEKAQVLADLPQSVLWQSYVPLPALPATWKSL